MATHERHPAPSRVGMTRCGQRIKRRNFTTSPQVADRPELVTCKNCLARKMQHYSPGQFKLLGVK